MNKLVSVSLILAMLAGTLLFTGCSGKDTEDNCVYYLNFKPEVADVWEQIAAEYTAETGIEVKVLTAPSNCNAQVLSAEIAKKDAPTIFQINGPVELRDRINMCEDLSDTNLYNMLVDKDMALSDENGVYGIPYVVEGYGIIYNDAIMQKYFALPNKATTYSSTDQINSFEALSAVASDMQANKDKLGIEGVFAATSFFSGEEWRWQTHLANLPIYYEYKDNNVDDMNTISLSYSENYKNIFDLYLNNSVCDRKDVGDYTVSDSMEQFALGKCAMVQNGNWAWSQISGTEGNVVKEEDCKYMPIYIGAEGEEAQGICVGTECYMCINANVSEEKKKNSIEFIEWVYSSDRGKEYVINDLQFITVFNTFSTDETPENPLARQVSEYVNDTSKSSVSWNFTTFPSQGFKDKLAKHLKNYSEDKETWDDVSNYFVSQWNAEKNGETTE